MAKSSRVCGSGLFHKVFTEGPLEVLISQCDAITAASLVGSSKSILQSAKYSATLPASQPFGLPCVLCCDPADKPWAVFKEDLPVHSKCKLLPLDRFSYDGLMPHGKDEERAGANGDWIAMVGPEGKWNLLNVYTHRKIKLPSLRKKLETTRNPLIFEYQRSAIQLQKIAICQVPTAARGYQDFSLVAIFDFAIAYLHGEYPRTWIFLENQFQYGAIYCDAIIHNGLVFAVTELGNMDGGERAKKPILSEMTSHSVTSDILDDKMDVGEGTKKRMLCEMTSKSVCSDIPDDKKHRVEENSILSDDKGEMACQSFKPPTPPCLLSMETDAAGPGTDEPIRGIIVPHEEGCGLGLPPAVETGGAAGAASVEPLVNGVVPREFSELEQDGLPIVKTDVTGADAGVATDDPAPEVATPPEGGFVLVEPVMTMPTVLTGGGPGAGRVEPLAKGVVPRESSEVDIGGLPSVDTGGLPGAGIVEISANSAVPPNSYELEHVPDVPSVEPDAPVSSGDDSAESDQEGSASRGQDVSCHSPEPELKSATMTEGARRGRRGDPRWAHPIGRRGPRPGRAALWEGGPQPLSPPFLRVCLRPENLSHRGYLTKSYSRLCGAEDTREKRALRRAGIRRGNSLPEGEIDAIAIVIELDIISIIIIIIISTIYTAITTAAPRHRCITMDEVRKKLFSISLSGKAAHWYKLLKNRDSLDWEDIVPLFYSKFYPPSEIHKDRNRIYNFWPHDGESIAQAWGRLKSLMLKCPIHELPGNVIIDNFYARLSFQDKTLLDTSCSGSFTRNKEEFKRDLLDRIQENTEGWENDKDRESGIIFDYKCIEAFMDTDKFRNMSATYGLDSQVVANLYKAFASHYELPKKNFDKYHEPYKDKIDSSVNKCVVIETVDHVIPEAYIEKTPFPAKMKEYSVISSVVNKSEKKPIEPEEQIKVEPAVAIVKDLVTENVEDGHIIFCEDASNIVSHPNKPKQVSVPMLSVRIGDHCYYGLCDIGASISAIPYELYTEIMHEIDSCELEDIDVVIQLANRETISPIGIVRDVEVLCGKIKYPADFLVLGSAASDYCPIIFGRPFLNTCGAIIDCKKEKILTKFAGESYEFNFSKFTKTPYKADLPSNDFKMEQCASIVLVPNNPLQQHLENSESEVFRKERDELEEIFLRQPILKHDLPVEDLGTTPPPKEDPVFDLKPLPDNLKYAHIDDKKIYPVIISSKLSEIEEERLLEILKKHRGAIGYTLDDLKGISPSICQHAINMEDDAKPVVEHQRRLIPKMKEVVRNEVLKLLEAGIIYPIADSRWVSPVHCVPKKGGMTVVPNDNDELIPQRVVVGNPSKEIFSELDEIFAQGPIFARSFQKTEEGRKWGHEAPTP
ncbi:hypothetical protein QYE76_043638 [Lolium multiflorum]|uniref:Retrotransposon gag domain-containing protein n=1 Tax=Lolium multiflorum TaxID=4521 RepID=A0AAD8TGY3_LOLMU|nr:hypothetical protein QYE76_043638 [Lolium multiflorum]